MTKNNYKVVRYPGPARTYLAEDRTTSSVTATMKVGEPVKVGGTGSNFVKPLATGDPEVGTDEFVGVVCRESDETSTLDGDVEVITCVPVRTVLRAKATTSTNVDTQTELDGLLNDWVCGDVTASSGTNGVFTIDEDEATDPNGHGFKIVDGDIIAYTLDVIVHAMAGEGAPNY
jgi:hypothetical protein